MRRKPLRRRGSRKRLLQAIVPLSLLAVLALAGVSSAAGASGIAAPLLPRMERARNHTSDLQRVLSVIEHRTRDGKVLEKMQEKLFTLSDRELHLAASLCERIARDDHSAGANIAFSLVTAMIVLS
jgi:hypothetical protein